jgi:hypothetical protein
MSTALEKKLSGRRSLLWAPLASWAGVWLCPVVITVPGLWLIERLTSAKILADFVVGTVLVLTIVVLGAARWNAGKRTAPFATSSFRGVLSWSQARGRCAD